jgi:hypothetical protein
MKAAAAALALALAAPFAASAESPAPPKPESFKFTVTGGLSYLGRQEQRVVTIEKWTTVAEARSLAAILASRGGGEVREEMLRWQAGTIRKSVASDPTAFGGAGRFASGVSLRGGVPVHIATFRVGPGGRRSVRALVYLSSCLGVLQPLYDEALPDFGLVELELDAKGHGISGRLVQAPTIAFEADGQLARSPAAKESLSWSLVGVEAYD